MEHMRMTRVIVTLAVWIGLVGLASASLTPRKDSPRFSKEPPKARAAKAPTPALGQALGTDPGSDFNVTERTEVLLNGQPCKYEAIPANGRIVLMDVAPDRKTVLRIHFKTGK
jgi:hypothetical protein